MNPDKIENSLLTGTEPDKHACPLCGRNLSEAEDTWFCNFDKAKKCNTLSCTFGPTCDPIVKYECACGYRFTEE